MHSLVLAFGLMAPTSELQVVMVGDILLHQPLHQQALRDVDGHRSLWTDIEPYFLEADIAYANLEGPMATGVAGLGREVKDPGMVFDKHVYTSYPMFNYHAFLAHDLKTSGIDIVSTANNHSLDRGSLGVDRTIEALNEAQLPYTGTRSKNAPQDWAQRIYKNGWTVSFLACAEHTNGIADPYNQVLRCNDPLILGLIAHEAREVDVVIVTPHWGEEYQLKEHPRQRRMAQQFFQAGADVIVGTHPHVVQPVERLTDGTRHGFVAYSTGNFVSNQFHRQPTQIGQMIKLEFEKTYTGLNISLYSKQLRMTKHNGRSVRIDGDWVEH